MGSNIIEAFRRFRRCTLPPNGDYFNRRFNSLSSRMDGLESIMMGRISLIPADQGELLSVLRLLTPKTATIGKVRIGSANDGGYVLLDDFTELSCALSFGIGGNDSWDLDIAERGIPVHQFDHTVKRAPSSHPLLTFHKKMIATSEGPDRETLPRLIDRHSSRPTPDILLKMDIEGGEWGVLDDSPGEKLARCAQIVCELHDLHRLGEAGFLADARRVLEKLAQNFTVVHVHGNNAAALVNVANVPIPNLLEVTFANIARYPCTESVERYPTTMDMPNIPNRPDIHLGSFRF